MFVLSARGDKGGGRVSRRVPKLSYSVAFLTLRQSRSHCRPELSCAPGRLPRPRLAKCTKVTRSLMGGSASARRLRGELVVWLCTARIADCSHLKSGQPGCLDRDFRSHTADPPIGDFGQLPLISHRTAALQSSVVHHSFKYLSFFELWACECCESPEATTAYLRYPPELTWTGMFGFCP